MAERDRLRSALEEIDNQRCGIGEGVCKNDFKYIAREALKGGES